MFCLELGLIFFSGGDFKPQNIEPQNVGLWHPSGAGEGEENLEVMVILSDSGVSLCFLAIEWIVSDVLSRSGVPVVKNENGFAVHKLQVLMSPIIPIRNRLLQDCHTV